MSLSVGPIGLTAQSIFESQKPDEQSKLPKTLWRVLNGLHKQVTTLQYFKLHIPFKNNFSALNTGLQSMLETIDQQLKACKYTKQNKRVLVDELQANNIEWQFILKKLDRLETSLKDSSLENADKSLQDIKTEIAKAASTRETFIEDLKAESDRLKIKIDFADQNPIPKDKVLDNLILRVQKAVPEYIILDALYQSGIKDTDRKKRYEKLKELWKESSVNHEKVQTTLERLELTFALSPEIDAIIEKLTSLGQFTSDCYSVFEEILTHKISEECGAKAAEKRLVTDPKNPLNVFQCTLTKIKSAHDCFETLKRDKDDFRPVIRATLEKNAATIEDLKKSKPSKLPLNLEDGVFIEEINKQRAEALKQMTRLQDNHILWWNFICISLDEVNHKLSAIQRFTPFVQRLHDLYFKLEDIREIVRNTRKRTVNRSEHQAIFDEQNSTFQKLSSSLIQGDNSDALKQSGEKSRSSLSLKDQFQAMHSEREVAIKLLDQTSDATLGLMWDSNETQKMILDSLKNHRKELKNNLIELLEKIENAYSTTLPSLCQLAANELNYMGQTLQHEPAKYDENFNEAYFIKNPPKQSVDSAL